MTWRLAGALQQLRAEVSTRWPLRSTASDGTIGDTAHSARKSDHNPDAAGVVRAWDCTRCTVEGVDVAEAVVEHLRARRDPRIAYLIFRGRICSGSAGPAPWTWRRYEGKNRHDHHAHISVVAGAAGDDRRGWGLVPGKAPARPLSTAPTTEEPEMTPAERKDLIEDIVAAVVPAVADRILFSLVAVRDPATGARQEVNVRTALGRAAEATEVRQRGDGSLPQKAAKPDAG